MKKPIPLTVLITPPAEGMNWVAAVTIGVPGYGSGTSCGDSVGQAIQDALIIALATGPEHTEAMVS
jgi:hypothetical protein